VQQGKYNTKEVWLDKKGNPLHPRTNYIVGGNTKFYGAALFRLREQDFGEIRHHGGISPAWPVKYAEMEPYYAAAERLYHVHGHETSASGREVTSVHVERDGAAETYRGDIVVSSCGAINSAALLLRSANDKHPRGLANGSDVVGRHYMGHINSVLFAISRRPNPTVFQKTLALNDFYFANRTWDYPMGHISFVGKFDANMFAAGAPKIVPGLTLDIMAKHSLDFWLTSEDLPDPENRVTLDRDGHIALSYAPNNLEGHRRLTDKLKEMVRHVECEDHVIPLNAFVGDRVPLAGVAHQNGTIRFGNDPKTSALDVNCKAHEVDNLYVVDGSFFPSSAAVNPALTIIANALHVGNHLAERLM
jgi:choline dehydrogenase-like flavoprotein